MPPTGGIATATGGVALISWAAAGAIGFVGSGVVFVTDIIGQTELLTGGETSVPILSLLAGALTGLAGTIVQGGRMFFRGDLVPKSLISAVVKEALAQQREEERQQALLERPVKPTNG